MIKEINIKESIWIIGDIHGKYDKLIEVLSKIPENSTICLVGDLIDRGRDSNKVVKLARKRNFYCVLGNHEQMALEDYEFWISEGGKITIQSYTNKYSYDINYKEEYETNIKLNNDLEWFKTLPIILKVNIPEQKPLYISHSGIKLNNDSILEHNTIDDILWNRKVHEEVDFAVNIHGHSPQKEIFQTKSQINIDTGANISDYPLTAINYPSFKIIQSKNY